MKGCSRQARMAFSESICSTCWRRTTSAFLSIFIAHTLPAGRYVQKRTRPKDPVPRVTPRSNWERSRGVGNFMVAASPVAAAIFVSSSLRKQASNANSPWQPGNQVRSADPTTVSQGGPGITAGKQRRAIVTLLTGILPRWRRPTMAVRPMRGWPLLALERSPLCPAASLKCCQRPAWCTQSGEALLRSDTDTHPSCELWRATVCDHD